MQVNLPAKNNNIFGLTNVHIVTHGVALLFSTLRMEATL